MVRPTGMYLPDPSATTELKKVRARVEKRSVMKIVQLVGMKVGASKLFSRTTAMI